MVHLNDIYKPLYGLNGTVKGYTTSCRAIKPQRGFENAFRRTGYQLLPKWQAATILPCQIRTQQHVKATIGDGDDSDDGDDDCDGDDDGDDDDGDDDCDDGCAVDGDVIIMLNQLCGSSASISATRQP